jgi:hypothetical protein
MREIDWNCLEQDYGHVDAMYDAMRELDFIEGWEGLIEADHGF